MKKLTPSEKAAQMDFIRQARESTGLDLAGMAERIGISKKTLEQNAYGYTPLTERNRASLERLKSQYRSGRPIFPPPPKLGSSNLGDDPNPSYGARSKLKTAREAAGLTPEQLAKKVGAEASYIRNLEDGGVRIVEQLARKLVVALPGLDIEDLMDGSESARVIDQSGVTGTYGAEPNIIFPEGTRVRYAPLLSHAQAGLFSGTWTDEGYEHTGVIAVDLPKGAKPFAIQIEGNSMTPDIKEGDYAIVLSGETPRQGDEVIVCLKDGEVMCKLYHSNGDKITLTSYNPAHPPIERHRDEIRWVFPIDHTVRKRRRRG